jgi:hypothetical protein
VIFTLAGGYDRRKRVIVTAMVERPSFAEIEGLKPAGLR